MYNQLVKPFLFRMDPERAHHLTISGVHAAGAVPGMTALMRGMYGSPVDPVLATALWGMEFANPIGLAAGLDKNAQAIPGFSAMGFGFLEVGTVTPRPQPGNEKPRVFRLPEDLALINRMGFNNIGAANMAKALQGNRRRSVPVCVNIGKNKTTPNEEAAEDYRACIRHLYREADLFAVNISSPNTPNLRALQHGEELRQLLAAMSDELAKQAALTQQPVKPVLLKLAPDLTDEMLESIADVAVANGISGLIATNTTISRTGLSHPHAGETGGLSGAPLKERANEVVRLLYRTTGGQLPIVGSGGIFTVDDAYERIRSGASLVELYTALIYEGPGITRKINKGLAERLRSEGFTAVSQAVGTAL